MDELLSVLLKNPEAALELAKVYIEKYKPAAYGLCGVFLDIYKDYANNTEYVKTTAKIKKNIYDSYLEVGFSEDQALALMINDNIRLMDNIKKMSQNSAKNKS